MTQPTLVFFAWHRPSNPLLVPTQHLDWLQNTGNIDKATLMSHLRWMMQKDALAQDIFLIGAPGKFHVYHRVIHVCPTHAYCVCARRNAPCAARGISS